MTGQALRQWDHGAGSCTHLVVEEVEVEAELDLVARVVHAHAQHRQVGPRRTGSASQEAQLGGLLRCHRHDSQTAASRAPAREHHRVGYRRWSGR